jgi:hypothetical protein
MNVWLVEVGAVLLLIQAGMEFVLYAKNKNKVSLFSAWCCLGGAGGIGIGALVAQGILDLSVWWLVGYVGVIIVTLVGFVFWFFRDFSKFKKQN